MQAFQPNVGSRPIDEATAILYFKEYIEIRKRSVEKIRKALEGDADAIRFYCGRTEMPSHHEDVAFLFDQKSLRSIMNRILADEADGLILFNAVRPVDPVEEPGQIAVNGRPTIMMFPYKKRPNANGGDIEYDTIMTDGEEHPGTGGPIDGGDGTEGMRNGTIHHLLSAVVK